MLSTATSDDVCVQLNIIPGAEATPPQPAPPTPDPAPAPPPAGCVRYRRCPHAVEDTTSPSLSAEEGPPSAASPSSQRACSPAGAQAYPGPAASPSSQRACSPAGAQACPGPAASPSSQRACSPAGAQACPGPAASTAALLGITGSSGSRPALVQWAEIQPVPTTPVLLAPCWPTETGSQQGSSPPVGH